ncbi:P-II family nitrogen regulator [Winogradskyella sp. PE311]|uniref:P-II family nitrogen regulator n=1 Tax=Winogradskyella sp. PE311 TaxID=3366943 RepID=UPI00397FE12B
MKKIEAIIRESKFSEVKTALNNVGVNFFSYWDVNSVNTENESASLIVNDKQDTIKKCYLSILVNDDFEDVTIKAILDSAVTGENGDGRIFISSINEIYKIRTKEKGPRTLR